METSPEYFLMGSSRINYLEGPLSSIGAPVRTAPELFTGVSNRLSGIYKLNRYIEHNEVIVINDTLNEKALITAKICDHHNSPFIIRPRGTVIGEFEDRRRGLPPLRKYSSLAKMRVIRKYLFEKSDGVIPVSDFVRNLIISANIAEPWEIKPVPIPQKDTTEATTAQEPFRRQINIDEDNILFVSVTGFTYKKKYEAIIDYSQAISNILKANPEVHYAIIGGSKFQPDFADSYTEEAIRQIRDRFSPDIRSRLHFTGYIENIEKAYSDSDILLHLSYRDSLAKVVMEASSKGLPIIVNSGGGMSEILPDTNAVDTVIKTNSGLEQSLQLMLDSPRAREKIGNKNKIRIMNRYCEERIGEQLYDAIHSFNHKYSSH